MLRFSAGPTIKVNLTPWTTDEIHTHDPNLPENRWDQNTAPGLVPLLGVLALVLVVSALAMMAVVAWWKFKRQTKMVNEPDGGALTYTNPTYSASNSDVNTDRKPFTWRRLHSENVHQVSISSLYLAASV